MTDRIVLAGATRLLIAPDSFKGSLTSVEVAQALGAGWARVRPGDDIEFAPLADGGEGTLAAIEASGGWHRLLAEVCDPLGRTITASWLRRDDGRVAVVEMAEASGLSRLTEAERDPLGATSVGTGDLLGAVLDTGVRDIVVGIGGSATTDGGAGLLAALGARIDGLDGATDVDLAGLDPRLASTRLRVACDVANPLLGPTGAAAVYGPQKGASTADVAVLDERLTRFAAAIEAATGATERLTPGAGAAGGIGFTLLCNRDRFEALEFLPGVELVMAMTDFDAKLARADLVITGEGRIDFQTAFGKTALGVAQRARAAGRPCIAVGGSVTPEGIEALAAVGGTTIPVTDPPLPLAEAIAGGARLVAACGERLARSLSNSASARVS